MSVGTPQGTATVGAIRFRDGEFAVEGVDAPSPQGQFKMERFALKSFSTASLMRWAASLTTAGRAPSPDQMLGLFGVLAGAEIKGVTAPFKTTNKLVMIDTLSLDWGSWSARSRARRMWLPNLSRQPIHPVQNSFH
ncbi:hypothetical protein [Bradyrhizobium lupini]|jgi:hypothetical protein